MEIFKILKYSIPCSLKQLFNLCPRNQKFLLMTPKVKLEVSKQNFVFKATKVWNKLIGHALERTEPEISGLIIPGSARNSDLRGPGGGGGLHQNSLEIDFIVVSGRRE